MGLILPLAVWLHTASEDEVRDAARRAYAWAMARWQTEPLLDAERIIHALLTGAEARDGYHHLRRMEEYADREYWRPARGEP